MKKEFCIIIELNDETSVKVTMPYNWSYEDIDIALKEMGKCNYTITNVFVL